MLDRGTIGKCAVCGALELTKRKWPMHNVIKCDECRRLGRKAKPRMTQYEFYKKGK